MNSVNLNSIQDFSQIHEQKVEQNFTANENPSKDFFSMLSENLSKIGESNSYEGAEKDSAPVQREKIPAEESDSPKEIPEKAISLEKKSSDSDERKAVRDEKKDGKKIASKDEGAEKKSRGKNLKTDEVLQGALVADAQGAKNSSAKRTENLEGKKSRARMSKKNRKRISILRRKMFRGISPKKNRIWKICASGLQRRILSLKPLLPRLKRIPLAKTPTLKSFPHCSFPLRKFKTRIPRLLILP